MERPLFEIRRLHGKRMAVEMFFASFPTDGGALLQVSTASGIKDDTSPLTQYFGVPHSLLYDKRKAMEEIAVFARYCKSCFGAGLGHVLFQRT